MTEKQRLNAELAIATALNSTTLYHERNFADPSRIRESVLGQLRDWFDMEQVQSRQFDRATTLELVTTEPLAGLVRLLDEMGKNPFSQIDLPHVVDAAGAPIPLWEHFINSRTSKCAPAIEMAAA